MKKLKTRGRKISVMNLGNGNLPVKRYIYRILPEVKVSRESRAKRLEFQYSNEQDEN